MARARRKRRERLDWVTNERTYVQFTDNYALTEFDGVIALPLTIADKNRLLRTGYSTYTDVQAGRSTWSAIPEGNRGSVRAVRGQIQWIPQEPLFGGNRTCVAWRIAVHEQDPATLGAIGELDYQLGVGPGAVGILREAAPQANERFLWERKHIGTSYGSSVEAANLGERIFDVQWSGRRTLGPNQALFLHVQVGLNSSPIFFSPWLRTLMVVGE